MEHASYKSHETDLRRFVKIFKNQFDQPQLLRRYELVMRRSLFLGANNPQELAWSPEMLHQVALAHARDGDDELASKYFRRSLAAFKDHEVLGRARVMRDFGLHLARTENPMLGLRYAKEALALHDHDVKNSKGLRQRQITESYVWRCELLVAATNAGALESLVHFALYESRDCSLRDQQEAVEFALGHVEGATHALLLARLAEIKTHRHKPIEAGAALAKFALEMPFIVTEHTIRLLVRRE